MAVSPIRFNRRHVKAAITFKQLPAETNSIHHSGWRSTFRAGEIATQMHGLSISFSLDHTPSPLESFLLQHMLRCGRWERWGSLSTAQGEASLKPKAGDQMWARPAADVFCLTYTMLKNSKCFKNQNVYVKILDFWFL